MTLQTEPAGSSTHGETVLRTTTVHAILAHDGVTVRLSRRSAAPRALAGDDSTLTVAAVDEFGQPDEFVDYSVVMAGVILSTIPLLILFVVAGRHFVSGIMQGAVKG